MNNINKNKLILVVSITLIITSFCVRYISFQLIDYNTYFFKKYLFLGKELYLNNFIGKRPFSYSPLYCYFIAFNYLLFPITKIKYFILLFQSIIGSIIVLFLFLITYKLFNNIYLGIISGFIGTFYYNYIIYDTSFLSDSLGTLLQLVLTYILINLSLKKEKTYIYILIGIFLGLCTIQRPNSLLLSLLIITWIYFKYTKKIKNIAYIIISLLTIISPIIIQNYLLTHTSGITASNPGYIFYSSNNYKSKGFKYYPPQLVVLIEKYSQSLKKFRGDVEIAVEVSSAINGKKQTISESSKFYLKNTFIYIINYPLKAITLFIKKFYLIYNPFSPDDLFSVFLKRQNSVIYYLGIFKYSFILPLGIIGIILSLIYYNQKYIFLYFILINQTIMMVIFYVITRFRLPIESILIIFSTLSLKYLYDTILKNKKMFLNFSLFITFSLIINYKPLFLLKDIKKDKQTLLYFQGEYFYNTNKIKKAIKTFEKIVKIEKYSNLAYKSYCYLLKIAKKIKNKKLIKKYRKIYHFYKKNRYDYIMLKKRNRKTLEEEEYIFLYNYYTSKKKYIKAYEIIKEAYKKYSYNPIILFYKGNIEIKLNKKYLALKSFKESIKKGILFTTNSIKVCYIIGNLYLLLENNKKRAYKYFLQAKRQCFFLKYPPLNEFKKERAILIEVNKILKNKKF